MKLQTAHSRIQEQTTITDLPNEILNAIISCFHRYSHLLQIALVSKRFKDLVDPFLYQRISLQLKSSCEDESPTDNNLDRCFFRLVKNLTQNSNLRRFVVALRLVVLCHTFQEVFNDHDQLITLLPSLKELTVVPPPPHLSVQDSERLEILRFDFFQCSEQFEEDIPEEDRDDPLEVVARHFWISTLRSLQFTTIQLHRDRRDHLFPEARYRTSPITDLRVMRCNDDDLDILPEILLSVRTLKRFMFESDVARPPDHLPAECIAPDWFAQALQPHQSTLVELVIAASDTAAFLRMPLFGSLSSYINLKRLGIPESFLVQENDLAIHEWLPPSLQVLQLQFPLQHNMDVDEETPLRFERMEHLAEHKLACLPALTRVIWWIQYYQASSGSYFETDQEFRDRRVQLAAKLNKIGVKFKLRSTPYLAETPLAKDTRWFYDSIQLFFRRTS